MQSEVSTLGLSEQAGALDDDCIIQDGSFEDSGADAADSWRMSQHNLLRQGGDETTFHSAMPGTTQSIPRSVVWWTGSDQ